MKIIEEAHKKVFMEIFPFIPTINNKLKKEIH